MNETVTTHAQWSLLENGGNYFYGNFAFLSSNADDLFSHERIPLPCNTPENWASKHLIGMIQENGLPLPVFADVQLFHQSADLFLPYIFSQTNEILRLKASGKKDEFDLKQAYTHSSEILSEIAVKRARVIAQDGVGDALVHQTDVTKLFTAKYRHGYEIESGDNVTPTQYKVAWNAYAKLNDVSETFLHLLSGRDHRAADFLVEPYKYLTALAYATSLIAAFRENGGPIESAPTLLRELFADGYKLLGRLVSSLEKAESDAYDITDDKEKALLHTNYSQLLVTLSDYYFTLMAEKHLQRPDETKEETQNRNDLLEKVANPSKKIAWMKTIMDKKGVRRLTQEQIQKPSSDMGLIRIIGQTGLVRFANFFSYYLASGRMSFEFTAKSALRPFLNEDHSYKAQLERFGITEFTDDMDIIHLLCEEKMKRNPERVLDPNTYEVQDFFRLHAILDTSVFEEALMCLSGVRPIGIYHNHNVEHTDQWRESVRVDFPEVPAAHFFVQNTGNNGNGFYRIEIHPQWNFDTASIVKALLSSTRMQRFRSIFIIIPVRDSSNDKRYLEIQLSPDKVRHHLARPSYTRRREQEDG